MAGKQVARRTSAVAKKITKQAVKKSGTKKAAPARRAKTPRAKRPSVAVVVLSGSTPLRRNKAAELVAEELQLDLAKVNLASVVSRQVGETEKNINRVFDEAERSGSILFFDGADALFGTGRAGKAGTSRPGHSHDQREKPDRSSLVAASEGVRDGGHQEEAKEEDGLTSRSLNGCSRSDVTSTGCSKRLLSKAAASEGPRRTLGVR